MQDDVMGASADRVATQLRLSVREGVSSGGYGYIWHDQGIV
jgi:hypothetical protein